ncbi:hypothetical protein EJ05DRAFT_505137 [Pseudovirgaria hyperparasitica]|uniref:Chaperone/heat shock protein Hsp12 n=1 Tax=Pseudovirgaria hyperparasitica TaxID=470096 RepID=A0A6A6VTM8_9PEZI|nr:uncharacterized protein EJ05DRAFT_505137 [Pseudovirgaria hyperparasitica]KAF2753505.1 hypothetical protein EJ05DRAFT_505137 [Pseudovirgaria hyperparasitica]
MTDAFRKDATTQAKEKVKPDSEKSMLEKGTEAVTGGADNAAGKAQPSGEKGIGQKLTDSTKGSGESGEGLLDQAKNALGGGK